MNQNVPGTANPFLAGMPAGSVASLNNPHRNPDYAGKKGDPKYRRSPWTSRCRRRRADVRLDLRHRPPRSESRRLSPDGEFDAIGHNINGSENGISDTQSPINALVGLFLDATPAGQTPVPAKQARLQQRVRAGTYDSWSPKLKQIFFIGDGAEHKGVQQSFIVPEGATRLYLATWDFYEWNNNSGQRNIQVKRPQHIVTVK